MSIYIQDAPIKLVIDPSGKIEMFCPESLTRQFPLLTPHVFVVDDKTFYGPYFKELAEFRIKNHNKEVHNG